MSRPEERERVPTAEGGSCSRAQADSCARWDRMKPGWYRISLSLGTELIRSCGSQLLYGFGAFVWHVPHTTKQRLKPAAVGTEILKA